MVVDCKRCGDYEVARELIAAAEIVVKPGQNQEERGFSPDTKGGVESQDQRNRNECELSSFVRGDAADADGAPWFVEFVFGDGVRKALV